MYLFNDNFRMVFYYRLAAKKTRAFLLEGLYIWILLSPSQDQ